MEHTFEMQIKLARALEANARLRSENAILRAQIGYLMQSTYERYLQMIEKAKTPELPGHLYVELHRGTHETN